jgi:transcriptional regulator with GAF, ATPase, and Fis domain
LEVHQGPDSPKIAQVRQTRFRVGALPSNDLRLTDPAVSRHHFELLLEDGGFRIRDLGSRNGTFVGDVQVREAILSQNARIRIGDTVIAFSLADESVDVPASPADRFGSLLGRSRAMRELFLELERVAATDATVLINGETGTGKEAVAEAIVGASPRAQGPLVIVDCGALAPTLVESELFGHEKGAYTGAVGSCAGAFERADGGTVLLDEIGELPLPLQPKLLRVLDTRQVQRLGGRTRKKFDIRILAATHRVLEEKVNQGSFRADLYYRLSVISLRLPPLRERREDIPLLAEHFLARDLEAMQTILTPEIVERLTEYGWPGNVRELRNAVERLALGSDPIGNGPCIQGASETSSGPIDLNTPFRIQKDRLIRDFEARYAKSLLEYSPGNVSKAARKAGMDRMAVIKLLQRHGLLSD